VLQAQQLEITDERGTIVAIEAAVRAGWAEHLPALAPIRIQAIQRVCVYIV
jgi:hypothetical protein